MLAGSMKTLPAVSVRSTMLAAALYALAMKRSGFFIYFGTSVMEVLNLPCNFERVTGVDYSCRQELPNYVPYWWKNCWSQCGTHM